MKSKSVLLVVISILASTANAEILYNVIDLGGNNSVAYSINNIGQVVGEAKTASRLGTTAILFDITGGGNNIKLGSNLSGNRSNAYSINNHGQAVGEVGDNAVLFDTTANNNNIILGTLGYPGDNGFNYGHASAINDNGQIVGHSKYGYYNYGTTLFDSTGNGNNKYLGGRGGDWFAINNSGQIVGGDYTTTPYHHMQAMLYDITGNNNILLGTFGGTYSYAYGINDSGQIVGSATYAGTNGSLNGLSHAALFDRSGNRNNIDLDPFGTGSTAWSINNNGQIVGDAGGGYATLFDITGAGNNINLNELIDPSLGWVLETAYGINDNGWIVGAGNKGAYLLTPIPEPATLFILGLGALFLRKRK